MSGDILFLAHRIPFPPDRGDKIRSHHILNRLAQIAPVHVATFADDPADLAHEGWLASRTKSHCLRLRAKPLWRAGLEALVRREPVSLTAFRDTAMADYVARVVSGETISTIYVFSGQMGQYVPADFRGQVLMDLVDVDSAKFDAYGRDGRFPRRWIDTREGRLLRAEEERLAHQADETMLVSEAEADLLRRRLQRPEGTSVSALRNGIDAAFFDPEGIKGGASPFEQATGPHIVFTGQMDYAPNIAAAQRLVTRIMPGLREAYSQASCHIVGRNPPSALLACDRQNGVRVWGEVPDVRPFVASADLVVVPLEIARGVQNKVLEAMAMARPVLLTAEAAAGIGGVDGQHFVTADRDEDIIAEACSLLHDAERRAAIGQAARAFVIRTLGWDAVLSRLDDLITVHNTKRCYAA
jgi:sugar transferase (PEP-CTERM/EpsH1 system associated)